MDNALYVGLSRQMTLRRELDIVANNIANADTTGFKAESLLVKTEPSAPARTLDGPKPVKFVLDVGVARDFTPAALHATSAPLDLGIDGPGFFKISTTGGERYTRNGHFRMDDTGKLVTQAGQAVLDDGGGEITLDPQKGAVSIATDGTISQGEERVGKVAVVKFDSLSALDKSGDNLYRNLSNQQPQPLTTPVVRQSMLENSNVHSTAETPRRIEVTRSYESMAKMMDSTAELSRRSVERMGRVQ